MYLFCLNENNCGGKKKKITIVKNNIAIRIAGKVSRYIDASMNRATPSGTYQSVRVVSGERAVFRRRLRPAVRAPPARLRAGAHPPPRRAARAPHAQTQLPVRRLPRLVLSALQREWETPRGGERGCG